MSDIYHTLATASLANTATWARAPSPPITALTVANKMMVKDQLVNTGRRKLGAVFGDNVKTGIKSLFMPGVKVGANSWVGPNFMVEKDLAANVMAFQKQNFNIREKKTRS